ncbi:DegT/DnrJ/EryC1/StrS family aminotransferase [Streptomyces sp. NPDC003077]|uniref:DegT/DnrJ/EryC1/StrS family aminotransferase n=1 Tax=Streptomyces sp. NPDC003077 TaxID=3154443 RepID=UPI0033A321CB
MGTLGVFGEAGIREGDEVVVPAFGNPGVAEAVVQAGAVPVFADVEAESLCLDPEAVAAAVTPRTTAVVAVHRFGHPADLARLRAVAERHELLLVEKDDPETDPDEGPAWPERRRMQAAYLNARLSGVVPPAAVPGHTYRQYVVRVPGNGRPDRDAFARALRARGVACRVPVRVPLYRLPGLRGELWLPRTERAVDETLALSLPAGWSRRELARMASLCNALGGLLQPAL